MAKARARPKKVAPGWPGFAGRLRYALQARQDENPDLTQNDVAALAGIDSGQFTKILSGERAAGLTANTALLLASALRVRPMWLMTNEEPSGLGAHAPAEPTEPPEPEEAAPSSGASSPMPLPAASRRG